MADAVDAVNITVAVEDPQWNSDPAWKLPGWAEPLIVVSILFGAMYITRRKGYSILRKPRPVKFDPLLDEKDDESRDSDDILLYDADNLDDDLENAMAATKHLPKRRKCLGTIIETPNSSRFKHHIHSRILQKFPFLIEMFYWVINYAFYRMTAVTAQKIFAGPGYWNVAQAHGISVLWEEEAGWLSFLFAIRERNVQRWFMHDHQTALTVLNKAYALIHIPGTVGFIAWYYYIAPSHRTFAVVRRTMTLTNFLAFITFVCYPCMPPRLLPPEYGFLDTVRHDDAQSVWMSGKYVNSLAAMPSMHFGYALCIGLTFAYHSGAFRSSLEKGEYRKSSLVRLLYLALGFAYPTFILVTIVATANHYFMDATLASLYVAIAFYCNRIFFVFLPLEDWLLWAIRADKPIPSTGERFRAVGGRL